MFLKKSQTQAGGVDHETFSGASNDSSRNRRNGEIYKGRYTKKVDGRGRLVSLHKSQVQEQFTNFDHREALIRQ